MEMKNKALEMAMLPKKEQKDAINKEFGKSFKDGLKIITQFVDIVKEADKNITDDYRTFQNSCDIANKCLAKTLEHGEVTEKEKEDVRNKIVQIINMGNDARLEAYKSTNETKEMVLNSATKLVFGVAVFSGAITALKFICDTILKTKK